MARDRVPGEGRFERLDASARGVALAGAALAVTVVLCGVLAVWLAQVMEPTHPSPPPISGHLERGGPPLNVEPEDTLADIRRRHRERLSGYDWLDRDAGIARIPIETAMRLLVERGWQEPAPQREPAVQAVVPARRSPPGERIEEEATQ